MTLARRTARQSVFALPHVARGRVLLDISSHFLPRASWCGCLLGTFVPHPETYLWLQRGYPWLSMVPEPPKHVCAVCCRPLEELEPYPLTSWVRRRHECIELLVARAAGL